MHQPEIWNQNEIAAMTGEGPNLIGFLIADRQIPHKRVGPFKLFDRRGVELIKVAIADYRTKAGPVVARPYRRKKRKAAAAS